MRDNSSKKILFYCQHLLGVGHLTRSLTICSKLADHFSTTFVQGGPDVGKSISHKNFNHIMLMPLLMKEDTSELYDPSEKKTVEDVFSERKIKLSDLAKKEIDCLVIELFPFGRNKFKNEIFFLIEEVKRNNPNCIIICSIRDILVEKKNHLDWERKVLKRVEKYFDHILVHSDPELIKFEETFSLAESIEKKIIYTGYVSNKPKVDFEKTLRKNKVLVSTGGGAVGFELLKASAIQAKKFPLYKFELVIAPNLTVEQKRELSVLENTIKNVVTLSFLNNFEEALASCSLSISLAGYNTVMNILETNTPSIVLPYDANREQRYRATKLMQHGYLSIVEKDMLLTNQFTDLIRSELVREIPKKTINLNGAEQSAETLLGLLGE